MSKPISQREASQWRKRALRAEQALESQRKRWLGDWPSSHVIARMPVPSIEVRACVRTARTLQHAVVVMPDREDFVFFACEVSK
jgi:hypothetical protein